MRLITCLAGLVLVLGCGPDADRKPAGTTNDPVAVCERVADVCRIEGSRLGVCTLRGQGSDSGFACASQH